uniref:G-protein coupled receptors family 1 profile domain-containing protein n=1 Tax=Clytia hemisphaerica TaxID=252671 RepID=A0A7M5VAN6_9CNID
MEEISSYRFKYLIPIIIGFIFLFNALAMIGLHRKRKDRDHLIRLLLIFFWNLCFCDIAVGFVLIINTILNRVLDNPENPVVNNSDNPVNKNQDIVRSMEILEAMILRISLIVSSLVLFIVTLIRIMALTKTYFRYRVNRAIVININATVWVAALLLAGTHKCIFEFYLSKNGHGKYEELFVPIILFPSVFVLTGCHCAILRILHVHGMSMQTYIETLRSYNNTRTSKKKNTWNIFATFGRSAGKGIKKKAKEPIVIDSGPKSKSKNNVIIENHYVCDTNNKRKQKLDLNTQYEMDKERCKRQVEALFSTKDISLLRFEVLTFLICWLPLSLVEMFHVIGFDDTWYDYSDMRHYTLIIVYLKSILTPFTLLVHKRKVFLCLRKTPLRATEDSTLKSTCSTVTTVM